MLLDCIVFIARYIVCYLSQLELSGGIVLPLYSLDLLTEAAIRYEEGILDIILLILIQDEEQLFPVRLKHFRLWTL